jgi:catechol 2,3-dioxygenase-like lactoylglutathione lyase family enzyme
MAAIAFALVGTNDYQRAFEFYDRVLASIGIFPAYTFKKLRYYGRTWQNGGPVFGVTKPINREPATVGNGSMVAFRVESDGLVDKMYAEAIACGGTCAGKPAVLGQSDLYRCYGAYFRDLDGNKIEVLNYVNLPDGHIDVLEARARSTQGVHELEA